MGDLLASMQTCKFSLVYATFWQNNRDDARAAAGNHPRVSLELVDSEEEAYRGFVVAYMDGFVKELDD